MTFTCPAGLRTPNRHIWTPATIHGTHGLTAQTRRSACLLALKDAYRVHNAKPGA
jgi:hypothetical protein